MPRLTGILPYLAWQEDARLFAWIRAALASGKSTPSAFVSRPCRRPAPTTKWKKFWPVSSCPARRVRVFRFRCTAVPHILPTLRAQANLLPASAIDR